MPNHIQTDPYLYSGTGVLINKFDIKHADALSQLEGALFARKCLELMPLGAYDYTHLKLIHHHFFGELYAWAGQERTIDIAKGDSFFAHVTYIKSALNKIFDKLQKEVFLRDLSQNIFCEKLSYYFNEINAAHPFREGNGRTLRAFCDLIAEQAGYYLNWSNLQVDDYINASIAGFKGDYTVMQNIFQQIITSLVSGKILDIKTRQLNKQKTTDGSTYS